MTIVLLNASYEVLSPNLSVNKAARLLALGKAIVEESVPGRFLGEWAWPKARSITLSLVLVVVRTPGRTWLQLVRSATTGRATVLRRKLG
jgi:hypothetical protein